MKKFVFTNEDNSVFFEQGEEAAAGKKRRETPRKRQFHNVKGKKFLFIKDSAEENLASKRK